MIVSNSLQNAYECKKVVKSVYFRDSEFRGWSILFTDNSSIQIPELTSVVASYVTIDSEDCWVISDDGGGHFSSSKICEL